MFFIVCLVVRFILISAHFPDVPKDYKDTEVNKIEIPRDFTPEAVNDTDYELIAPTLPPRLVDIILSEMVEPSRPNNRYETFAAILNRHHLTDEERAHLKLMDPYWLYSNKLGQFVPNLLGLPKNSGERRKLQEYLWGPMTPSTLAPDFTFPSMNEPNYDHLMLFNFSVSTPTYFRIGPDKIQQITYETPTTINHQVFGNLSVSNESPATDQVPNESISPDPNLGDTAGRQLPAKSPVLFTSDNLNNRSVYDSVTNGNISDSKTNGNLNDSITTGKSTDSVANGNESVNVANRNISDSVTNGNISDSVTSGTASEIRDVVAANISTVKDTISIITPSPSVTVTPITTVDDFPGYPDAEPGGSTTTEQILYILSVPSTVTTGAPLLELDAEVNDEEHAVITKDGLGVLGKDWIYNDASPSTMPDNIIFDPIPPMDPESPPSMADELNNYVREHGVGIFSAFLQKFLDMYAEKNYTVTKALPRQISIHFLYPYNARDLQIFDEYQSDFSNRFLEFTGTVMAMTKPEQFQRLAIMSKDMVRKRRAVLSGELNDLIDRLDKGYEADDAPKFIKILEAIHGYPENNVSMAKIVMHIADDVFFNGYRSLKQPEDRKFVALTLYKYILLLVKPDARKKFDHTKSSRHIKISQYFTMNSKKQSKLNTKLNHISMVQYFFKDKNKFYDNIKKIKDSTKKKRTFFRPVTLTKKVSNSDRFNNRVDMINNIKSIKYRLKTKQITRNNVYLKKGRLITLDNDNHVIMNRLKKYHKQNNDLQISTRPLAMKCKSCEYYDMKNKSIEGRIDDYWKSSMKVGTEETQITKYDSETVAEYAKPEKRNLYLNITTPTYFEAKNAGYTLKDTMRLYTKRFEYPRNTKMHYIKTRYNAKLADITARSSNSDEELLLRSNVRAAMFGRRNDGGIVIPNSLSDDEPIIKMNLYKALGVIE